MARRRYRTRKYTTGQELVLVVILGSVAFYLIGEFLKAIDWNFVFSTIILTPLLILAGICIAAFGYVLWFRYKKYRRYLRYVDIQHANEMKVLGWRDFEFYVASIFEQLGYAAKVTRGSQDGGVDIWLSNNQGIVAVQCKHYITGITIGVKDLRELVGAANNTASKFIFVTLSDFSNDAKEYAQKQGVLLVDAEGLGAMARKAFGIDRSKKLYDFMLRGR